MPAWIFGQPTKCTFNSMARAAACGSRQKSRTPSYSMPRPASVWGISGPCACGMGGLCSVWKPANLMGPASFSFSSNFAPPVVGPGDGLWSLPTTPLITTRDSTNRGGKSTPTVLSWTSFPLIVPNSTRSNECGSSHAVAACIIATSKILRTLSALSKRNLQIGHVATMCYADYAQLLKTLCLDRFLEQVVDEEPADVPWSRVAALLTINRLCAPGSELAIEQRWYPSTALDDLLAIEAGKINDTRLYRCLDRILPHKTKLEQHLKQRYGELFGSEFDVLLYDLTSTYVEGVAEKNPMMRRGYSRDHRPDCEQMVIALIVNSEGFPFSYETFDGNRADVSTMETILRMVERKYGKARRIWVLDRGIVSEENLEAIRRRGGQYLAHV